MKEEVEKIREEFYRELSSIDQVGCLREIRVKYLGRRGMVTSLMEKMRSVGSKEEKARMGQWVNGLKKEISQTLEDRSSALSAQREEARLLEESIDISLPGRRRFLGKRHPVVRVLDQAVSVLVGMGFSVQYSPEIESEYYNYTGLNYPPDHPAREMQDTFYLDDHTLLRSHTTAIQQHIMENVTPPIRIVAPGKCYRNETVTSRSHVLFHQIDALYIDRNVSLGDLLEMIDTFFMKLFQEKTKTKVRPSYFPFVEPGIEVDVSCTACAGQGCSLCKHSGWLEICGAGMVHPKVLEEGNIDPEHYSGYAWGLGVERLFMCLHGVEDIRYFTGNDLRFLSQFPG